MILFLHLNLNYYIYIIYIFNINYNNKWENSDEYQSDWIIFDSIEI